MPVTRSVRPFLLSVLVCARVLHTSKGLPMTDPTPPVRAPARNLRWKGASGPPAPMAFRTGASVCMLYYE